MCLDGVASVSACLAGATNARRKDGSGRPGRQGAQVLAGVADDHEEGPALHVARLRMRSAIADAGSELAQVLETTCVCIADLRVHNLPKETQIYISCGLSNFQN